MSTAVSPQYFSGACVVMGVASCGKTSVGEALALKLGVGFIEGDSLHPAANVAKMRSGSPLNDEDRWPWLAAIGKMLSGSQGKVASCSALKRSYREKIAKAAGRPVAFVFLDGSRELLQQRINSRQGHFMPASLLESQLATLEAPEADEVAIRLNVAAPVDELADQAFRWLMIPK